MNRAETLCQIRDGAPALRSFTGPENFSSFSFRLNSSLKHRVNDQEQEALLSAAP